MDLRERWEAHATKWIAWARAAGHDSYWRFHRDQFLQIVPPPGHRTVDIGCGEGRLTRHLKKLGHDIVGVDASPSLVAAARELDPSMDIRLADAAALPLDEASAIWLSPSCRCKTSTRCPPPYARLRAFSSRGAALCFAIVHPINSAGRFETEDANSPFVIKGDYLRPSAYADTIERDGLTMTFHSQHRPLQSYVLALEEAGMLIETLREPRVPDHAINSDRSRRWQRLPLFLHLRAMRP